MKTIKANNTLMGILEDARIHTRLAMGNSISKFDYLDMASEEINLFYRKATIKNGYGYADALDEIYQYTGWDELYRDSQCMEYLVKLRDAKRCFKK